MSIGDPLTLLEQEWAYKKLISAQALAERWCFFTRDSKSTSIDWYRI